LAERPKGKLILVTAISPTPAGEGKTTTTVGLGDALNHIGKRAVICLREPSLGPVFGMKGGAAGGGFSQVIPMEDINLHFTGDFNAIALANNLLAAMIDNHIHHGNELGFDVRRITWKRVVDLNDRALREITASMGGPANGFPRQDGFELQAQGAMAALLKDALAPNLVQTLEHTPALIHGGPFANIAHGCSSVLATTAALRMADYVVTEAGFGADLGAEKFINIKCRKAELQPAAAVLVATVRALKYHGGADLKSLSQKNLVALKKGIPNIERHALNIRNHYGLSCVVAINHRTEDSDEEITLLMDELAQKGFKVILARHWSEGGKGATELANEVVRMCEEPSNFKFLYQDSDSIWDKMKAIATKIYGASDISANAKVRGEIQKLQELYGHYPVCVAKTQYSFSTDPTLLGAPTNHVVNIREVRLAAGAEFIVMVCGDIMTMPGLPKVPGACNIDVGLDGKISGLF